MASQARSAFGAAMGRAKGPFADILHIPGGHFMPPLEGDAAPMAKAAGPFPDRNIRRSGRAVAQAPRFPGRPGASP